MTKRRTKAQKFADYADAVHCINKGEPVKRQGGVRKDGSIATHPICDVEDKLESEVLVDCLAWLQAHHILCNRMNVGAGTFGSAGFRTYGIIGGGDIFGIIPPHGRHLEVECKKGKGGSWSRTQQRRARLVIGAGGIYIIVHGTEELALKLEKYL